MSKNILLVMLEFDNWQQARAWSYTGAWAFQDGLEENGHRCTVLPAIWGRAPDAADSFIHHAESILGDTQFDEAWVWCVHTQYDEKFWQWLKRVAPRRIGITMESLTVAPEEAQEFPQFAQRQEDVLEQLSHCTHAIVADEADIALVQNRLSIPATWNVVMVPERFVRFDAAPEQPKAAFIGNKYGQRIPYLEDAGLAKLLYRPHLPERDTDRPERYDAIHQDIRNQLLAEKPDLAMLQQSTFMMKLVREALFRLHLDGIRTGFANVNLPSMLKAYAGRVTESMAAATPSVSWLPPDRPDCATLFKAGEEIELFTSPAELHTHLAALATDSERRNRQVIAARNTLLNRHTTRIRLRQYGNWLDQGIAPDFFGDIGYKPTIEESQYYKKFFAEDKYWSLPTPNGDERARWEKIQAMIERVRAAESEPLRIAEVGCGRGWMSNLCSQYGAVLGVEPVGDVIHHAQTLFPNLQFLTGNADLLHFLGFGGFFDLLVCSEVIEHLPYTEKAAFVANLVGLVKPGGHLIITTPRMDIYPQWSEKYDAPPQPTEDWLTEAQVETLFRDAGCEPLELQRAFLMDIYQVWLFQRSADIGKSAPQTIMKTDNNSMRPILSIAIPTYNRAQFLKGTLTNLCTQAAQTGAHIEVIVSDNCSADTTPDICQEVAKTWPFVKIVRNSENIGAEGNVMSIMRQSSGEWVWLFGDDDIPHPGAVKTLLELISAAPPELAMYLLNYRQVNRDGVTQLSAGVCDAPEHWRGKLGDFFGFRGSFDMLGFISALLIRKDSLDLRNNYEQFNSYYAHIGYLIQSHYFSQVHYIATPILDQRQNNQRTGNEFNDNEKTFALTIEAFVGLVLVLLTASQQIDIPMGAVERLNSKVGLGDLSNSNCVPMLDWAFNSAVRNDLRELVTQKQMLEVKADLLQKISAQIASADLRRRIETAISIAVSAALSNNALQASLIALRQV